jgi:hypothetical protein
MLRNGKILEREEKGKISKAISLKGKNNSEQRLRQTERKCTTL